MKYTVLVLGVLGGFATSAFAQSPDLSERLVCSEGKLNYEGTVTVELSSKNMSSGYKRPVNASVHYQYSMANKMVCEGYAQLDNYDIRCAGYYFGTELTEIRVQSHAGQIWAFWKTAQGYNSQDKVTLCKRESP
ncbi:hypothetical protein K2X30_09185 [bacterium]|nr:hypothetical protein [bacterium]